MLLFIKIIGIVCIVAIPASVCGAQVLLNNKKQVSEKKEIEVEIQKTEESFRQAAVNYEKQITRIKEEKNALADTKNDLTYNPVNIKDQIDSLKKAKSSYETAHGNIKTEISTSIIAHNTALNKSKTEIETLWSGEKTRVEGIQSVLEGKIIQTKLANKNLQTNIEDLKTQINTQINANFTT